RWSTRASTSPTPATTCEARLAAGDRVLHEDQPLLARQLARVQRGVTVPRRHAGDEGYVTEDGGESPGVDEAAVLRERVQDALDGVRRRRVHALVADRAEGRGQEGVLLPQVGVDDRAGAPPSQQLVAHAH